MAGPALRATVRRPAATLKAVVAATALVVLAVLAATRAGSAGAAPLADATADRVNASTPIPDAARRVGEVRLLSRGEAVVVQTLLQTRLLARVAAEIRVKERRNWPADDLAVAAYLAALDRVRDTIEKQEIPFREKDRRRRLLIEFAADAGDVAVMIGTFRFAPGQAGEAGEVGEAGEALPEREILETLALPRAYVLRNLRLILADSFKVAETEVDRLGPLGPAAASGTQGAGAPSSPPPAADVPGDRR